MFDYRNAGLLRATAQAVRDNIGAVLIFAALTSAIKYAVTVMGINTSGVADAILGIFFAFVVHRTVLYGKGDVLTSLTIDSSTLISFLLKSLAVGLVILLLVIPGFVIGAALSPSPEESEIYMIVSFLIVTIPLIGIFLSLYGTLLPAAVLGTDTSFRAARDRSRGQFWTTFIQFMAGPVLIYVASTVVYQSLNRVAGIPIQMFNERLDFVPVGAAVDFVFVLLGFVSSILMVIILCKAYLHATPQTDNT